jgi:hypothetical protein
MARRATRRVIAPAPTRPTTGQLTLHRSAPLEHVPPEEEELPHQEADPRLVRSDGTEGGDTAAHLRGLLHRYSTRATPDYLVRRFDLEDRFEYQATVYVFHGTRLVSTHMGPARRSSSAEAVADAAFEALTCYADTLRHRLDYTVYEYFPRRRAGWRRYTGPPARHFVSRNSLGFTMNLFLDTTRRLTLALEELQTIRDHMWMMEERQVHPDTPPAPGTTSDTSPIRYSEGSSPAPPSGPADGASRI